MGVRSQLNDVGSDSIPLLLLALIASLVSQLRSLLAAAFHSDAGIVAISDHHPSLPSFLYSSSDEGCIFCLNQMKHGDWVRRLPCNHIFHKSCFDGWLHQMKFNCPLCRSQIISVENDVAAWFAVR